MPKWRLRTDGPTPAFLKPRALSIVRSGGLGSGGGGCYVLPLFLLDSYSGTLRGSVGKY